MEGDVPLVGGLLGRGAGEEAGPLLLHRDRLHRREQLGQPGVDIYGLTMYFSQNYLLPPAPLSPLTPHRLFLSFYFLKKTYVQNYHIKKIKPERFIAEK